MTTSIEVLDQLRRRMVMAMEAEGRAYGLSGATFQCSTSGTKGSRGTIADVAPHFTREPLPSEIGQDLSIVPLIRNHVGFIDDLKPNPELARVMRMAVRRHARAAIRERMLKGHDALAPWSLTLHVAMDALLRHHGVDVRSILTDSGMTWTNVRDQVRSHKDLGLGNMAIDAGRLLFADLHDRSQGLSVRLSSSWTTPNRTSLRIMDTALPATMIVALKDVPLHSVIDRPAFRDVDVRVSSACNDVEGQRRCVHLDLSYDHVAIAPPPKGVERLWMEGDLADA